MEEGTCVASDLLCLSLGRDPALCKGWVSVSSRTFLPLCCPQSWCHYRSWWSKQQLDEISVWPESYSVFHVHTLRVQVWCFPALWSFKCITGGKREQLFEMNSTLTEMKMYWLKFTEDSLEKSGPRLYFWSNGTIGLSSDLSIGHFVHLVCNTRLSSV